MVWSSSTDSEQTPKNKKINLRRKNRRSIKLRQAFYSLSVSDDNRKESKKSTDYLSKYDESSENISSPTSTKYQNMTKKLRRKKLHKNMMPIWILHDTDEYQSSNGANKAGEREIEKKSEQTDKQQFKMIQSPLIRNQKAHSTLINDNDQLSLHVSDELSAIVESSENLTPKITRHVSRTSKYINTNENVKELRIIIPEHEQIQMSKRVKLIPDEVSKLNAEVLKDISSHSNTQLEVSKDLKRTKDTVHLPTSVISEPILLNSLSSRKSDRLLRKRTTSHSVDDTQSFRIPKDLSKHKSNQQVDANVTTAEDLSQKSGELSVKPLLNKYNDKISPTSSLHSSSIRKSERIQKRTSSNRQVDDLTKESDKRTIQTTFNNDSIKNFRTSSRLSSHKRNNQSKELKNLTGKSLEVVNNVSSPTNLSKKLSVNSLLNDNSDKHTVEISPASSANSHQSSLLSFSIRESGRNVRKRTLNQLEKVDDNINARENLTTDSSVKSLVVETSKTNSKHTLSQQVVDSESPKNFRNSSSVSNIQEVVENLTKTNRSNRTKESITMIEKKNSILENVSKHTLSQQVDDNANAKDLPENLSIKPLLNENSDQPIHEISSATNENSSKTNLHLSSTSRKNQKKSRRSSTRTPLNENHDLEKEITSDSASIKSFRNSPRLLSSQDDENLTNYQNSSPQKKNKQNQKRVTVFKSANRSDEFEDEEMPSVEKQMHNNLLDGIEVNKLNSATNVIDNLAKTMSSTSDRSRKNYQQVDDNLTIPKDLPENLSVKPLLNENSNISIHEISSATNENSSKTNLHLSSTRKSEELLRKHTSTRSSSTRTPLNENRDLEKEITSDSASIKSFRNSPRLLSSQDDENLTNNYQNSSPQKENKQNQKRVTVFKSVNRRDEFEDDEMPPVEKQSHNSLHDIEVNNLNSATNVIDNLAKTMSSTSDRSQKSYQSNSSCTSLQDKHLSPNKSLVERDKQSQQTRQTAYKFVITSSSDEDSIIELFNDTQEVRMEEQQKSSNEIKTPNTTKVLKQTEIQKYLECLKMKKAIEDEKFQQKIEQIKNVPINEPPPSQEIRKKPPKKKIQSKPQDKILKELTTIDGKRYRKPKEFKKPAYWVTEKLQSAVVKQLSKRYEGSELTNRVNDLILQLVTTVKTAYKRKKYPHDLVESLKYELATESFIETNFDFFNFINDYVPRVFWKTIVPQPVPGTTKTTVPYDRKTVFSKILK